MTVNTTVCPRVVGASGDGREMVLCGAALPCSEHAAQPNARGERTPFGTELLVNLGLTQDEYDRILRAEGSIAVSKDPGWHSHPILGITGHLHRDGTKLHGHRPEVIWGDVVLLHDATEAGS